MNAHRAQNGEIQGRHVLVAMLLFFGAVIAVDLAFTIVAVRSFPGEDERRSYLQGLRYNDVLAERERERALGWHASASINERDGAQLSIVLTDSVGEPIRNASVTATLQRPASDREDRTLVLPDAGGGSYSVPLGALAPGVWRLRAVALHGGQRLQIDRRLEWRSTR